MDRKSLLEALHWHIAIGAEEAIGDEPRNHLAAAVRRPADPPAGAAVASEEPGKPPARAAAAAMKLAASTQELAAGAGTLEQLRDVIASYDGLDVKHTATNMVFADGNPEGGLMVIGEAPGSDEDRQGKPFVGASGKLLDRMLAAVELDRTTVYITNVLNWRPPGNRKPTPAEVALSLPFLLRHIELVHPRAILLSGDSAAKAVTGRAEGITRLRGKWHDLQAPNGQTYRVLPTFHPSFLLRSPARKAEAWQDMLLFKEAARRSAGGTK